MHEYTVYGKLVKSWGYCGEKTHKKKKKKKEEEEEEEEEGRRRRKTQQTPTQTHTKSQALFPVNVCVSLVLGFSPPKKKKL